MSEPEPVTSDAREIVALALCPPPCRFGSAGTATSMTTGQTRSWSTSYGPCLTHRSQANQAVAALMAAGYDLQAAASEVTERSPD